MTDEERGGDAAVEQEQEGTATGDEAATEDAATEQGGGDVTQAPGTDEPVAAGPEETESTGTDAQNAGVDPEEPAAAEPGAEETA